MRTVRPVTLCTTVIAAVVALLIPAAPARADSTRDDQWWLKSLDVAAVHQVTQGEGVTVAVVDSGVDADHPDLRGNVLPGADLFDPETQGRVDPHGHGTGVAALIAGHGHGAGNRSGILGIAPKAKILPVRIMRETGVNPPGNVAQGINWAIDNGADVINVSIGTSYDQAVSAAVERAYQRNIPVVAAAGNKPATPIVDFPASHPGAIGVTITGRKDRITSTNVEGDEIDMAAPGEDIISAVPGGRYNSNTSSSRATAIASGAVALVRAKFPTLNAHDVFERMMWTTRDIGDKGKDLHFGAGTLDLDRAVTGEPDNRDVAASPTPAVAARTWEDCRGCPSTTTRVLQTVAIFGGLLLVIGLIVFFLVRHKRKKRQGTQGAVPATVFHQSPGSYDQSPAAPPQPQPPVQDETAWRRPPGS